MSGDMAEDDAVRAFVSKALREVRAALSPEVPDGA